MKPIKLVNIFTKRVDDDSGLDDLVTEYNIIYDSETGEIPIGLKIISSCQYDQSNANEDWRRVFEYIKEDERRMNDYGLCFSRLYPADSFFFKRLVEKKAFLLVLL